MIFISSYHIAILPEKFYLVKVYYYILNVFEGNLKNVCQKVIKTIPSLLICFYFLYQM